MTDVPGTCGREPRVLVRMALVLVVAAATGVFAWAFAWLWTDEAVSGSPYASADPVGAALEGASAGVWPTVLGLVLCAIALARTRVTWWWPAFLVTGVGAACAVLGTSSRFPEGMDAAWAGAFAVLAVVGVLGLLSHAVRTCRTS
jgi:hypothetical protein